MLNSWNNHLKLIRSFPKKKLHHVIIYCLNEPYDSVADMKDFYVKLFNYNHDDVLQGCWLMEDLKDRSITLEVPFYGFDLTK